MIRAGAILTVRETEKVQERLRRISAAVEDRRIKEQCRLVACTVNQAGRRARKQQEKNNPQKTHTK